MFEDMVWDLRHGDLHAWGLIICLVVMIGCLGFMVLYFLDGAFVENPIQYQAEIVDGAYKPDTRETHVQPVVGMNSSGDLTTGMIVMSSGSDEEFKLMVRDYRTMEVYSVEVNATTYYDVSMGQVILMEETTGKIFGYKYRKVIQ